MQGTWVRWIVTMVLFNLVGWWFGVLEWVILWQICTLLHNFGGWSQHWFGKSLIMMLGTIAQLAQQAWQLARHSRPKYGAGS